MDRRGRPALLAFLSLAVSACGGEDIFGLSGTVNLSGSVAYEFVPPNANCDGLDFASTFERPIRGATVQLLDATSGEQLGSTVSGDSGSYSFSGVPRDTLVTLRVRAELKQPGIPGWDVDVRDNFVAGGSDNGAFPPAGLSARPLYVADSNSFNTGTVNLTRDLTVSSGWDGAAYSSDRAAAPFAILDVFYAAMQFIRSVDPHAHFPELDAFWSVNNTLTSDDVDLTAGQLSTSSYYLGIDSMFILGDENVDTDEFDQHIIAHEWAHFFEDNFSRIDAQGGAHNLGERLVASLAFSEGWASAMAAIIHDDPIYCDTRAAGTSLGGGFSAETSALGVKGWFNELSVIALIYDLWDAAADGIDTGSIGFTPMYDVLTGPQAVNESWSTIFSFAAALRTSLDASGVALLDALLVREDIISGADLDIWATSETNDAAVPASVSSTVLPLYVDYVAGDPPINLCVDSFLDGLARHGNNPGQERYLRITVPFDDEYDVSVVTTTPTPPSPDPDDRDQSDPDIYILRGNIPVNVAQGVTDTANFEPTFRTPVMFAGETYVGLVEEWRFSDPEASVDFPQVVCFDVSLASTP